MARYRELLKEELISRCEKNAKYSLRAFARDLEISPGFLSKLLNGKRGISTMMARKLAYSAFPEEEKRKDFMVSVESELIQKFKEERTKLGIDMM